MIERPGAKNTEQMTADIQRQLRRAVTGLINQFPHDSSPEEMPIHFIAESEQPEEPIIRGHIHIANQSGKLFMMPPGVDNDEALAHFFSDISTPRLVHVLLSSQREFFSMQKRVQETELPQIYEAAYVEARDDLIAALHDSELDVTASDFEDSLFEKYTITAEEFTAAAKEYADNKLELPVTSKIVGDRIMESRKKYSLPIGDTMRIIERIDTLLDFVHGAPNSIGIHITPGHRSTFFYEIYPKPSRETEKPLHHVN
jgi:hypothetical protein